MKYSIKTNGQLKVSLFFEDIKKECRVIAYKTANKTFNYKLGEMYFHHDYDKNEKYLLVGMGKSTETTIDDVRQAFYLIGKKLIELNELDFEVTVDKIGKLCNKKTAQAVAEGLMNAEYKYDKYLSEKQDKELTLHYFPAEGKEQKVKEGIDKAILLMNSVFMVRDMVNEPAMEMYPEVMADIAVKELSPLGVKVEVYNKKEIQDMQMNAFLSVNRGSDKEPRLIVMRYLNNPENTETIALVGKGITYDTGGYSLKPSNAMDTMFCDMAGGATVIGAIHAAATAGLKVNVIGVVAATENAVNGSAYKPGDIVRSMSGKTIEIENTDAEGRVTLADSVYYATSQENVTKVVDLATLTGACLVALGEKYTATITNNEEFHNEVAKAVSMADEKIWQLPNDKYFKELNKSRVADIKNTGGRYGGTITAGLFIQEFVKDNIPWVHMDIAGTAFLSKPELYLPQGATGAHVKSLYYLLENMNKVQCGCK